MHLFINFHLPTTSFRIFSTKKDQYLIQFAKNDEPTHSSTTTDNLLKSCQARAAHTELLAFSFALFCNSFTEND